MPEFYQITQSDDLLEKLNFILREIYKRIDRLDSLKANVAYYNNIDMNGHKITNGPVQITAEDREFITKAFIDTVQAAEIIRKNLQEGGKAPIFIPTSRDLKADGGFP